MLDFAAVFSALTTAAVVVDASSRIVALNPAAQRLLGAHVVVGTAVADVPGLVHVDGVAFGDGCRLLQPVPSPVSNTVSSSSSYEELWTSYIELRRTYRQLVSHLDQAPVMMAILRGRHHVFEIVNPLYEQYAQRPLLGLAVAEAFPEVVAQGVVDRLDQVYRTGEPMVLRSRTVLNRKPDDATPQGHFDVIYAPLRDNAADGDDTVTGVFILATDVSERQQTQDRADRLEEQKALVEAERGFLLESIPQQAWIGTPDGQLDFVNDRVATYFGEPRATLLGNGWQAFVHDEDLPRATALWARSLTTGDDLDCTFRLRRHDGAWRWHVARAMAMRDETGAVVKWFGTSTDIDDQARAAEELSSRAEFEQLLIGIVSHDLRNPLNAIALSTAVVDGSNLDDKQRAALKRVTSATTRAARLISDLLDFSQARRSGTIPVHKESLGLARLIDDVIDERRAVVVDRRVEVAHDSGDVVVSADGDRLAQLLDNLVGNALQHSPKGSVVRVCSRCVDDDVVITIDNDGVIAADDLPRLFLPFQRGAGTAGGTAGSTAGGTSVGLGLYIAVKIAEAHSGRIEVSSTTSTRFTVTLPRACAAA